MGPRHAAALLGLACCGTGALAQTRNIMITGYWPPTNEMIRRWSPNPVQNPAGWIGQNWEGRGYNIYAYFPEFPGGVGQNPKGDGDFEVDYQDTSIDWWRITAMVQPVAIITFSRGNPGSNWEMESRLRNLGGWIGDYLAPLQPTPSPPDKDFATGGIRNSSLPMQQIADNVNAAGLGINAYIDRTNGFGGGFLSEFIGYHGMWYQSLHAAANDPIRTLAAGHIHVGINTPTDLARTASEITLRTLTAYLDTIIPAPGTAMAFGLGLGLALRRRR